MDVPDMAITKTAPEQEPESKQRLRLWLRLLRATRRMENALREELRRADGMTLPRFDVLAVLHRREDGLTMSELSRLLMVSNGNVTGIVERLVEDGWIARTSIKGDRRVTLVCLTEEGRTGFEALAARHEGWVNKLLGVVSIDEVNEMLGPLERIADEGKRR